MDAPWLLWQLADSAFPAGGFAHSGGLEAALAAGRVDPAALEPLLAQLLWNVGTAAVPFVVAAHRAGGAWAAVDRALDAFLTNPVGNRASRTQGRALLGTSARVFPRDALRAWDLEARRGERPAHLGAAFGATLAALGVDEAACAALFVHQSARGALSAAVRLGALGTLEAQRVQHGMGALCERVAREGRRRPLDEAAVSAPLPEIWGGLHDALYARLFQS